MKHIVDPHELTVHGVNPFARSVWLCKRNASGMSVDFQNLCYRELVGFRTSCLGLVDSNSVGITKGSTLVDQKCP